MPTRTPIALPLAAGLLTCLTIGLSLRLAARTAAQTAPRAPLVAHADAPRTDGLLPLSRLPASATDNQRMAAWWDETGSWMHIDIMAAAGIWGKHDKTLHLTLPAHKILHYGDVTYAQDVVVQIQKRFPNKKSPKEVIHTPTGTSEQQTETVVPAVDEGAPQRYRLSYTRTAKGLHVKALRLPD